MPIKEEEDNSENENPTVERYFSLIWEGKSDKILDDILFADLKYNQKIEIKKNLTKALDKLVKEGQNRFSRWYKIETKYEKLKHQLVNNKNAANYVANQEWIEDLERKISLVENQKNDLLKENEKQLIEIIEYKKTIRANFDTYELLGVKILLIRDSDDSDIVTHYKIPQELIENIEEIESYKRGVEKQYYIFDLHDDEGQPLKLHRKWLHYLQHNLPNKMEKMEIMTKKKIVILDNVIKGLSFDLTITEKLRDIWVSFIELGGRRVKTGEIEDMAGASKPKVLELMKELKRLNKVDLEFKDMWSLIEEKG